MIKGRILSVLIIAVSFSTPLLVAQEITEENYLKIDKEIWDRYEQEMEKISTCYREYPEKKDSLMAASEKVLADASKKNVEAAIRYASVPSGLQRLYMVRLDISKDTIRSVLRNLPQEMQTSPYGKSLFYHLDTEQVEEGSNYTDFKATDTAGNDFILSSLKGKNILLLYGGLGCMGKAGRDYLNKIYNETSRENFEIVVYCLNSNLESLQKVREEYPCDYFLVSDFLQDHTPMKILYGAQAMPTCFLIDKQGKVLLKETGVNQERIMGLLKEQEVY